MHRPLLFFPLCTQALRGVPSITPALRWDAARPEPVDRAGAEDKAPAPRGPSAVDYRWVESRLRETTSVPAGAVAAALSVRLMPDHGPDHQAMVGCDS